MTKEIVLPHTEGHTPLSPLRNESEFPMESDFNEKWLTNEADRLFSFMKNAQSPVTGFYLLDSMGNPQKEKPVQVYNAARLTHVSSLEYLSGNEEAKDFIDSGISALASTFFDHENAGWFSEVSQKGAPTNTRKTTYDQAHIILATSSATTADRPGAAELLEVSLNTLEDYFYDEKTGLHVESYSSDWSDCEAYRGANSNMHSVEALMAAGDVTGDRMWHDRALRIADFLINKETRENGWRLPEHFSTNWEQLKEYNKDAKADPFRPYGLTVGHWLEWSRLLLQLEGSIENPPSWLKESSEKLFAEAVDKGWSVDGNEGFVYTLDWENKPSVRTRMHWVLTEALGATSALYKRTGKKEYEDLYNTFWQHADEKFIDRQNGSWHHELDHNNNPSSSVWSGKPDIYHAYQATLIPRLPLAPSFATAIKNQHLYNDVS